MGPFRNGMVVVGQLFVAELAEPGRHLRVAVSHLLRLIRLGLADDALHRLGAGVGRLFTHQGGGGAQGEAG